MARYEHGSVRTPASANGAATLPAGTVKVRYAVPVLPLPTPNDKPVGRTFQSNVPENRFDGLLDTIPAEIPVSQAPVRPEQYEHGFAALDRPERLNAAPGAVAPLWLTARVPRDAKPGGYEGLITISAEGLPPTNVPLRLTVHDWSMPDPKDFRMHNAGYNEPEVVAKLYGVPLWSDRHLEMQGRSQALMAQAGSRQVFVPLCPGAMDNTEGLIRWVKKPDGSYTQDYTALDRFFDMVAKHLGKPFPLRLIVPVAGSRSDTHWGYFLV